jgi:hypothetical protein
MPSTLIKTYEKFIVLAIIFGIFNGFLIKVVFGAIFGGLTGDQANEFSDSLGIVFGISSFVYFLAAGYNDVSKQKGKFIEEILGGVKCPNYLWALVVIAGAFVLVYGLIYLLNSCSVFYRIITSPEDFEYRLGYFVSIVDAKTYLVYTLALFGGGLYLLAWAGPKLVSRGTAIRNGINFYESVNVIILGAISIVCGIMPTIVLSQPLIPLSLNWMPGLLGLIGGMMGLTLTAHNGQKIVGGAPKLQRKKSVAVHCPNCGRKNLSDALYCSECGEKL